MRPQSGHSSYFPSHAILLSLFAFGMRQPLASHSLTFRSVFSFALLHALGHLHAFFHLHSFAHLRGVFNPELTIRCLNKICTFSFPFVPTSVTDKAKCEVVIATYANPITWSDLVLKRGRYDILEPILLRWRWGTAPLASVAPREVVLRAARADPIPSLKVRLLEGLFHTPPYHPL